jgi:hypothetical protein
MATNQTINKTKKTIPPTPRLLTRIFEFISPRLFPCLDDPKASNSTSPRDPALSPSQAALSGDNAELFTISEVYHIIRFIAKPIGLSGRRLQAGGPPLKAADGVVACLEGSAQSAWRGAGKDESGLDKTG